MTDSRQFIPVNKDYLIKNTILSFDIFRRMDDQYYLFKHGYLPIIEDLIEEIDDETGGQIYIRADEYSNYNRYIEDNFDILINKESF